MQCEHVRGEVRATGHRGLKIRLWALGTPNLVAEAGDRMEQPAASHFSRQALPTRAGHGLQCELTRGACDWPPRSQDPLWTPGLPAPAAEAAYRIEQPLRVTPSRQVLVARVAHGLQCAIARGATDRPPRVRASVLRPGAPKLAVTRCPAVPDVGCGRGEVPASRRTDSQEAQVGRASRSSERGLVGRDCRAMLGAIGAAGCGHLGVSPVVRDLPRGPRRVAPSPAVPLGQPCGANPSPCTDSLDLPSRRSHAGPPSSRHRSGVLHACGQRSILWIRLCQLGRPSQPCSWA